MFDSNWMEMESSTKVRITGVSMSTTSSGSKVTQRTLLGYADEGADCVCNVTKCWTAVATWRQMLDLNNG